MAGGKIYISAPRNTSSKPKPKPKVTTVAQVRKIAKKVHYSFL